MTIKEFMIKIKNDEKIIKGLVKNIKNEVENTISFDEAYEAKMKEMQKEYTEACSRLYKAMEIYEKNTTTTEIPES